MTDRMAEWRARRKHETQRRKRNGDDGAAQKRLLRDSRTAKVAGKPCRVCGTFQRIEAHHIVPSSKMLGGLGKHHGQLHHPFNLMPLCHVHHVAHHTQGRAYRVPRSLLTRDEAAFVQLHTTPGWYDNWYPDHPHEGAHP